MVAKLTSSFDFHHNFSSKHLNIHYFNNKSWFYRIILLINLFKSFLPYKNLPSAEGTFLPRKERSFRYIAIPDSYLTHFRKNTKTRARDNGIHTGELYISSISFILFVYAYIEAFGVTFSLDRKQETDFFLHATVSTTVVLPPPPPR